MMPDPKDGKTMVDLHHYPKATAQFHVHIKMLEGIRPDDTDLVVDSLALAKEIDKNLDLARLKGIAQLRNSLLALLTIHQGAGRGDHVNALRGAISIANAMLGRSVSDHQIDDLPGSVAAQAAADSAEPQSDPFIVRPPT